MTRLWSHLDHMEVGAVTWSDPWPDSYLFDATRRITPYLQTDKLNATQRLVCVLFIQQTLALAFLDAADATCFDREKRRGGEKKSRIHEVAEFGKSERFTFWEKWQRSLKPRLWQSENTPTARVFLPLLKTGNLTVLWLSPWKRWEGLIRAKPEKSVLGLGGRGTKHLT